MWLFQFRFASGSDVLCMIVGTLCAMLHGSAFPVMIIVFGEMIDLFVSNGAYSNSVMELSVDGILAQLNLTLEAVLANPTLLE